MKSTKESKSEAKSSAIADALARAKDSGKRQALWIVGPGRYSVTDYRPADHMREGFLAMVWPDGGIDYA